MFAPLTMGNSLFIPFLWWLLDLSLLYTGQLTPINCYSDSSWARPGWKYLGPSMLEKALHNVRKLKLTPKIPKNIRNMHLMIVFVVLGVGFLLLVGPYMFEKYVDPYGNP